MLVDTIVEVNHSIFGFQKRQRLYSFKRYILFDKG